MERQHCLPHLGFYELARTLLAMGNFAHSLCSSIILSTARPSTVGNRLHPLAWAPRILMKP